MTDDVDKIARNRELWDDRVPAHVASDFYDVDGFRRGRSDLRLFEVEEVGPVDGLDLVHLQCHFGLDSLSWARLGARVTGVDFSAPAVDAASALAGELDLPADFVVSDVYDAVAAVGGRTFDIAYTGLGALNWLPDLGRWADVVAGLLRPGGFLYLTEFHPLTSIFSWQELTVERSYWADPEGDHYDDDDGSYIETDDRFEHNESWEWNHPLEEVIGAVLGAGLQIESFHEHRYTLYRRWPFLEPRDDGSWWLPAGMPELPLMYSLKARRPS